MLESLFRQAWQLFGDPKGPEIAILVVDICLVYYVLYRLLLLIRGTRALQMLTGLLLVVLGYFFSSLLGLTTLHWIISNFMFQAFLIIIVVFQNDIRRALIRLGQSPFLAGSGIREDFLLLEELVRASIALASKRIGAIIVIERSHNIRDFFNNGTLLDAKVSKELLQAIFVPEAENPIHDGAVIVRNGRIHIAGCFLPLSQSTKLERSLGTRHRAALGVSENTDAVVIVVSEERATVSLCADGELIKDLEADELRTTLFGFFERRPGEHAKEKLEEKTAKEEEAAPRAG